MSQEQQPSAPDAPPQPPPMLWEFRKMLPTLILSVLMALAASWWNSEKTQSDFRYRIEMLEKRAETNALNISNNSTALQQNAIRVAEISIIQNNTLEQIKDLKQQQSEIQQRLRGR